MQVILSPQPSGDSQKDLPKDLQDKVDGVRSKLAGVRAMLETSKQQTLATQKIAEEAKRLSSKRSFPN
jgi:cell division septum initiation protein DivIVA